MKNNIRDNFEAVYLRFNQAQRDLKNVSSDQLKAKEFIKIYTYTANTVFYRNRELLLSSGYDIEDVMSLAQTFGACYIGDQNKVKAYDERRYNLMMIAYIFQRLMRFVSWVNAKFEFKEISIINSSSGDYYEEHYADYSSDIIPEASPEEQLHDLLETFEETQDKNTRKKIGKLRSSIKSDRTQSLRSFASKKETLISNIDKYSTSLAFYACTKHSDFEIRKVAKKYCKKYNIDYKTIMSAIIDKNGYNSNEFDLT
jgi:hypothetical protein